jgi:hypothetical protein
MDKLELRYGAAGWLESDPEDVLERVFDNACHDVAEDIATIYSRVNWPVTIREYKRIQIDPTTADRLAEAALKGALAELGHAQVVASDCLDTSIAAITEAAKLLGSVVVTDYLPLAWVPTGNVLTYTREQSERCEPCKVS